MYIWRRVHPGWYEMTDAAGERWRVVQSGSHKWRSMRATGGAYEDDCKPWYTMADAKDHCEGGGMEGHRARKAGRVARV